MYKYFTLDDFNLNGKVVGVRVDINSPIIGSNVVLNERITAHAKTLAELSNMGAKIVVLAHQGRKGRDDCVSLKVHSKLLSDVLKKPVKFSSEVFSENVSDKIGKLKNGEILLLENLRFSDDETKVDKRGNKILKLEKLFNFYVIDAFSVAHREQTSIVGFSKVPLLAGRVMEKELNGLNSILDVKRPSIYSLGGAKPDDLLEIIETNLKKKKVDFVLLSGVIGEVALMASGTKLGCKEKFLKDKGYLNSYKKIQALIKKYSKYFVVPKDVAIYDEKAKRRIEISVEHINDDENQELLAKYLIQDVGLRTVKFYSGLMKNSASIYFKGPAGNFELKPFEVGTRGLIKAIVSSGAFTYMGGGHSVTAISSFAKISDFSYVSLAGGALVKFLSGHKLPGVMVLEESFNVNKEIVSDDNFIVVGSNTRDVGVNAPRSLAEFQLGDKVRVNDDFKTSVGGGGVNVSICLSRLGANVSYLGKLSYENRAEVISALGRDRVKVVESKISKRSCAKSVLLDTKDRDRIIFTFRGQNAFLDYGDFDSKSLDAKNFYFSSIGGKSFETLIKLSAFVKKKSVYSKICLNLSSYLIRKERKIKNLLKRVDIIVLNFDEACEFTGCEGITACFKKLVMLGLKLVVITDGENGAYAYDGEEEYFCASFKGKRVLDTTGAGDSYAGTFFYYYVKGFGVEKAMGAAAQNASSVIAQKGAQKGLLYGDDIGF